MTLERGELGDRDRRPSTAQSVERRRQAQQAAGGGHRKAAPRRRGTAELGHRPRDFGDRGDLAGEQVLATGGESLERTRDTVDRIVEKKPRRPALSEDQYCEVEYQLLL
jgi:hypothetical protein